MALPTSHKAGDELLLLDSKRNAALQAALVEHICDESAVGRWVFAGESLGTVEPGCVPELRRGTNL